MQYRLFDIHSHLNFPQFDADREEIIARMRTDGIGTITIGTSLETSRQAIALARQHEHVFATIGIHPTDTEVFDAPAFVELVADPNVVAIGECGLDYYRDQSSETKAHQRNVFQQQLVFAREHNLPVMIHGRPSAGSMDAYEDTIALLKEYEVKGNVHFFVGTTAIAQQFLDLGFTLSFDGPITFTHDYDDVVRYVPADALMAETDSPFAAPAPFRGKRADPTMVQYVAERIAEIRGVEQEEMKRQLTENALTAFALPPREGRF